MVNLQMEALEIEGAQKLLEKLRQEWKFSIVPAVRKNLKPENVRPGCTDYEWFEAHAASRKFLGDGLVRCLLSDKENMRKFLYGDATLKGSIIRDKKGKVTRVDIDIIEE